MPEKLSHKNRVNKKAYYGRFFSIRCNVNDKKICGVDVTEEAGKICSGRQSCQLEHWNSQFNAKFYKEAPCSAEFSNKISVSYTCLKYLVFENAACLGRPIAVPMKQSGYLSNLVQDVGLRNCPWFFNITKLHRVTFTLWDYEAVGVSPARNGSPEKLILAYMNDTPICREEERKRQLHVDGGKSLRIWFVPQQQDTSYFIQYDISECQPYETPSFARLLFDSGLNITVECLIGDHSSLHLTCHDGVWTSLTEENCTMGAVTSAVLADDKTSQGKFAVMITIVIAVALIISTIIIVVGLYCLEAWPFRLVIFKKTFRRIHKQAMAFKPQEDNPSSQSFSQEKYSTGHQPCLHQSYSMCELYPMLASHPDKKLPQMPRDYATTMQMRKIAGCYPETAWCPAHGPYYSTNQVHCNTVDRKYSTSNIKRNISSQVRNFSSSQFQQESPRTYDVPMSPFYHELDQFTFKNNSEVVPHHNAISIPCPTVPEQNDPTNIIQNASSLLTH
ncbi:hypothetical protein HELRODRAFT_192582 [Helobdella robusta]|uniref:SUEL-type lectin domain-containing protein n=1 Tax=Helobdella robusta TaxID=6412 RepID=T1FU35_HELRO|nr:hypothetical protein HELRODRAFT_192582 [Helobdella robusta]ESO00712.1 hypothetical protein HELRODRAFT_192582 [Helobdella robusta]